jgi:hypothetical protein
LSEDFKIFNSGNHGMTGDISSMLVDDEEHHASGSIYPGGGTFSRKMFR